MKRLSACILILAATAVIGWLGLEARDILEERRQADRMRATLPSVELVDLDDAPAAIAAASNRSTVLVFFTTTCEYCRKEIAELKQNVAAFDRTEVVLISPENRETVGAYRRESGLNLVPQFRMLRDTLPGLSAHFRIRRVPTVLVYGRDGKLTGEFEGMTSVTRILQAAEVPR